MSAGFGQMVEAGVRKALLIVALNSLDQHLPERTAPAEPRLDKDEDHREATPKLPKTSKPPSAKL